MRLAVNEAVAGVANVLQELDLLLRLELSAACWSVVCVNDWQVKVLGVNGGA
ncbi:MAG TPA: hypothetical protein VG167_04795 [Verrucomicrobiae bacterium]|nr:hypothetical protein [Verrucomicrobiae bacterium]